MKLTETPRKAKLLVVDDEAGARESLEAILEDEYEVAFAVNGNHAVSAVEKEEFDLVLLDLSMPEMGGMDALEQIRRRDKDLDIIIVSAIDRALEATTAIQHGAYDYITKPFDPETILTRVERAIQKRHLEKEVSFLRSEVAHQSQQGQIISQSRQMRDISQLIDKLAGTPSSVLITGESGTGKELIARAIHAASDRHHKPFVAINCASIPSELIESELFGHEKGAFTGAHIRAPGKFEFAHGGTLLLDEVSSLKVEFQAQLLRVLQEREFTRVGGHRLIKVDVRIIAATNRRLEDLVKTGAFREDLFFRLNVIPINVPPLRNRDGDIALLAHHFLAKFNRQLNKDIPNISKEAMIALESYPWPGNIRELENLMERMVVLGTNGNQIEYQDLPSDVLFHEKTLKHMPGLDGEHIGLISARHSFERQYILRVLRKCSWNQTEAAHILRVHRNTLIQKIKNLNIRRSEERFL
jgi:DNA-binding NtrC family response regulator